MQAKGSIRADESSENSTQGGACLSLAHTELPGEHSRGISPSHALSAILENHAAFLRQPYVLSLVYRLNHACSIS
eukprot:6206707-Pleurochrysis_carterae.AAC.1